MDPMIQVGADELSKALGRPLRVFHRCVSCCGGAVASLEQSADPTRETLHANWRQANWELLVETPLREAFGVILEVYDGEADLWDASCRILSPDVAATHQVVFSVRRGAVEQVNGLPSTGGAKRFDGFASLEDGWPSHVGDLGFARSDGADVPEVYALADVTFHLERIAPC